jgi:hypothetical protein
VRNFSEEEFPGKIQMGFDPEKEEDRTEGFKDRFGLSQ